MKQEIDPAGEHRNVARLLSLLQSLADSSAEGLRLTDLVGRTGMGKTTAHRLLSGLMSYGLAEQDGETGRFFIGLKILSWAAAAKNRFSFTRLAEPALVRISQMTQDTVYLVVRVADEVVCIDAREGTFPIRVLTLDIGDRRPLGIGAGSLAILAALPDEEVERILSTHVDARAQFPFDEVELRDMIGMTRRTGYAYNNVHLFKGMEKTTEMAAIALPIRRGDGLPVAALHLTGITSRLEPPRRDNIVAGLRQEIIKIELELMPILDQVETTLDRLATTRDLA